MSSKTLFGPFSRSLQSFENKLKPLFQSESYPIFSFGNNFSQELSRYIFRMIFIHRQIELILNSYAKDLALINFVNGFFLNGSFENEDRSTKHPNLENEVLRS